MKPIHRRMLVIALLMFAGATLALAMKPTKKLADLHEKTDLETMVPQQIGEWKIDTSIVPIEPSPEAKALLNKIYNQTLSRTYVNPAGHRIMLSIAYGGDQSDSMHVHLPEVCYAAAGFEVLNIVAGTLLTKYGEFPVKRLMAIRGNRYEPVIYWIVTGDKATMPGLQQKFAQIGYGLTGKVPDGFLMRVSSIDRNPEAAYQQQEEFVRLMLGVISEKDRVRIAGRFGS